MSGTGSNLELPPIPLNLGAAKAVLACHTTSLRALAKAGGLDLATDFRGHDLQGWPLGGQDLRGFDFSGSNLRGTGVQTALVDETTRFDGCTFDEFGPPSPHPPIPEDYVEQAKAMILAGQAPPAHWAPHLTTLNFDDTDLVDLRPLSGLTALQRLDAYNTQVSDIAPLSDLPELTIFVENDDRVGALNATLRAGSAVKVVMPQFLRPDRPAEGDDDPQA